MAELTPPKLLLVEDDPGLRRQLAWAFDDYEVLTAEDRVSAEKVLETERPPVVLMDLGLPPDPDGPSEGLATLQSVLRASPATKVIIMSGQTERDYALKAVALGAYDFYQKPIDVDEIKLIVDRAQRLFKLEEENRGLLRRSGGSTLPGVVTSNPEMLKICDEVAMLAASSVTILLNGESGTGKELLAQAIHKLSARAGGPFVAINCAAIPEQLLESELFGHEKGAFTGAIKTTIGKVEQADGGTLFLDEIGDMPASLQAKLLRFLQERVIERVGGRKQISVDIRVVSATNQDLMALAETGGFRSDLYYRVGEAVISIPPLRERLEDAVYIANRLLRQYAEELDRPPRGLSSDAMAAIVSHQWPGNVRELQNCLKRAVAGATSPILKAADLRLGTTEVDESALTLRQARDRAEKAAIRQALAIAKGNISEAARLLDTSRPTVYQLMKQHDISLEDAPTEAVEV